MDVIRTAVLTTTTDAPRLRSAEKLAHAPSALMKIAVGSALLARQIGPTVDGHTTLRIADTNVKVGLPAWAENRPELRLTMISSTPSLIFAINRDNQNFPVPTLPSITQAASLLSSMLIEAKDKFPGGAVILTTEPLSEHELTSPERIASVLSDQISKSGLFYESHLRQWNNDERRLPEVSPQKDAASTPTNLLNSDEVKETILKQIHILDSNAISWAGNVWPGQKATLTVVGDDVSEKHGPDSPKIWKATLSVDLPNLGVIKANITYSNHGASIEIEPTDKQTSRILHDQLERLRNSLDATLSIGSYVAILDDAR